MTHGDLAEVNRSWAELAVRRDDVLEALTRRLAASGGAAAQRAEWLFDAVAQLVGLLASPSRLGELARELTATWPDSSAAPSFGVEGRAWLDATSDCVAAWSERTESAWKQAWLLLAEVLAAETLSPFGDARA